MAQKFLTLEEAAQMLGITKERLSDLRETGKIHGYRDGASWKFKEAEVERVQSQGLEDEEEELTLDYDSDDLADLTDAKSNILASEKPEPDSPGETGSTVIGKLDALDDDTLAGAAGGSDLSLDLTPDDEGSGELLLAEESDPSLASDVHLSSGASDILSSGEGTGSGILSGDDSSSKAFEGLEEIDLELDDPSADMIDVDSAGDSDLALSTEDSVKAGGSSSLELDDDDDGELLLGEGSGSDITLSSEDSGIQLIDPADSGLSLDSEPLELTGSMVGSLSLDDDEETFELESLSSPKMSGQLEAEDDFALTPADDSDESSSQVIALDSSEVEMAEAPDDELGAALIEGAEDEMMDDDFAAAPDESPIQVGATPVAAGAAAGAAEEPDYTAWNLMSLGLCIFLLAMGGMMMGDLMRSMWSWNETYTINSALMDGILGMLGLG